jgi:hypothetical protein
VSTQDAAGSDAVKSVIFSLFNSSCTKVFTLVSAHAAERQCDAWNETQKAAELKLQKRAGATPLFRLSAAQKVLRGRSRPLVPKGHVIKLTNTRSRTAINDFNCGSVRADAEPHTSCFNVCMTGPQEGEK